MPSVGNIAGVTFAFVSALGAVYGLSVFGSGDASRDEAIARLSLGFGGLISFGLLYFWWIVGVPVEWDGAKQAEIDGLKAQLEPKVRLVVTRSCGWIDAYRNDETGESRLTHNYCIGVENLSDTKLNNVFLELDRFVEPADYEYPMLPRKLRVRGASHDIFDLAPRKTEYVHVISVDMEDEEIRFQFGGPSGANRLVFGNYKLKLKAYCDQSSPKNEFMPLRVTKGEIVFSSLKLDDNGFTEAGTT